MLRGVKGVFDPEGLCNPGKVVPEASPSRVKAAAQDGDGNRRWDREGAHPKHAGRSGGLGGPASGGGVGALANLSGRGRGCRRRFWHPPPKRSLAQLLAKASQEGWRVLPAGLGLWLEGGGPAEVSLVVSTSG